MDMDRFLKALFYIVIIGVVMAALGILVSMLGPVLIERFHWGFPQFFVLALIIVIVVMAVGASRSS